MEEIRFALALGLLLLLAADFTLLRGQVPNAIFLVAYLVWFLWIAATADSERSQSASDAAPDHGLRYLSEDASGLPDEIPYRVLPGGGGAARDIRESVDSTRPMYVFEAVVLEEKTWYDADQDTRRLAVCCLRLRASLPTFHVEVGKGWKRVRGPWSEPRTNLSRDSKVKILVDPIPAHVRDAIFHPAMVEWLATLGSCEIAVSGEWLSFASPGGVYRTSPTQLMRTTRGFEDRIRGEAFD
jgi:hypothetical protein